MKKKLIGVSAGYLIALITSPLVPEYISLFLPVVGLVSGHLVERIRSSKQNLPDEVLPVTENPAPFSSTSASPVEHKEEHISTDPEFAPIWEYIGVLEDIVISEGQKNSLDDEIVEKSLVLFTRVKHVLPLIKELSNGEINHTVRRLVLKDLNSLLSPFLRLSGELKTKNRRMVLNGLKDISSKINSIVKTIEHKDLLDLQTKADLIHTRYNQSEI